MVAASERAANARLGVLGRGGTPAHAALRLLVSSCVLGSSEAGCRVRRRLSDCPLSARKVEINGHQRTMPIAN